MLVVAVGSTTGVARQYLAPTGIVVNAPGAGIAQVHWPWVFEEMNSRGRLWNAPSDFDHRPIGGTNLLRLGYPSAAWPRDSAVWQQLGSPRRSCCAARLDGLASHAVQRDGHYPKPDWRLQLSNGLDASKTIHLYRGGLLATERTGRDSWSKTRPSLWRGRQPKSSVVSSRTRYGVDALRGKMFNSSETEV